jgi:pyruvate/2-oxoglutarate dehydrogenase complex dihydrolipoamide acyltransferase (E2) component
LLAGRRVPQGQRPASSRNRAVDGATAAGFLARLRGLIEQPLDIVL